MVQVADGGGGGGNAGPQERKLFQAYQARLETLEGAAQSWTDGADLLAAVAHALGAQAGQLETSFGPNNPTGKAAAERYRQVQAKVKTRAEEMSTASGALKHSHQGLVAAQADYDALPPVTTNPNEPQTDMERLLDPGGGLKQAKYDGERAEREKAAGVALTKLDTHFEKSAKDLRTVAGDAPTKSGGGGGGGEGSGGSSPLSGRQGGGPHVVSGTPTGGGGGGKDHDPGVVVTDHGPRGPRDDGNPGNGTTTTTGNTVPIGGTLAGGSTDGNYGGSTSGGSYGGGSTATPTSGSGAGVTSAMGAGVVSGAGAIAASRGGVAGGARVPGAAAGSSGAIGRSSSTAARGAIGRSGTAVPGQGSTAARSGGAGGRGAAGGRGGVGAGQGQAGKNGGRGGAGSRGRGGMGAGQGGRGGKKDEKDVTQEHLAFADEESWLDDEGANDSVID